MKYKSTNLISMPIGGIGSGSIGIAGNGRFTDIEIGNCPNKQSHAGFTHFAVKAERDGKTVDARVLNGDIEPPYVGIQPRPLYSGYGFGPDRGNMAGMPHFKYCDFNGEFPFANLSFQDPRFPGDIRLCAFNPFIPSNEDDSSIPAAFFLITVKNTSDVALDYTVALTCNNFYSQGNCVHKYDDGDGIARITLGNAGDKTSAEYGDLTVATDCEDTSCQRYWYKGHWFDNLTMFWQDFCAPGRLVDREHGCAGSGVDNQCDYEPATLEAHFRLDAGGEREIRFVLAWNKPYMNNSWEISAPGLDEEAKAKIRAVMWKNYYATIFESSHDSALYALCNFDRLYGDTMLFKDALHSSTLPKEVLDAVAANISILKTPTVLRLTDGSFYGFEGLHPHMGSCEGTCTHVWSYVYAPAFLFPRLERSARRLEYTYSMAQSGAMTFRLQLPVGRDVSRFRPCVDGQYGTVLRVYREFMVSGDIEWLRSIWGGVKKSIEYAWHPDNYDRWDPDKSGIMRGRQHHTLDMELFGESSWLSGMYLAGLKAGAELAKTVGDTPAFDEYSRIAEKGAKQVNERLFNGEYFIQQIDICDKSLLEQFSGDCALSGNDAVQGYWNDETGEIKYQAAQGCLIDQVLGQWHLDLLGLGDVFERDKVESALKSIYKYNFIEDMRNHCNPCRIYALNDESGTIICSYPETGKKPRIAVPYAEETMHGFEYQAACHMIIRGMEEEGLRCVRAVRERYDGVRRNPYNEIECGSNYARSMASYALLLAYSGFRFNMYEKRVGFSPLKGDGSFFWSLESGFGKVVFNDGKIVLHVLYGGLDLKYFAVCTSNITGVLYGDEPVVYSAGGGEIVFEAELCMKRGDALTVEYVHG